MKGIIRLISYKKELNKLKAENELLKLENAALWKFIREQKKKK